MAIRYSGDVEVRVERKGRVYRARVRAPHYRHTFDLDAELVHGKTLEERYDQAARYVLAYALGRLGRKQARLPIEYDRATGIHVQRVYQSACPAGSR